ncbi:NAD-dependent epimerase [Paenibacillus chitinolyticus]|uniref:NAD-dependent epimerase n=3 Tax=Paenibacillus TaxID=44249 RepID=A0A410X238_9BACL|nr:NAD-dependent epimerase [Paenibacillus chitinolyticus]MCY9593501.1 NAD-dependent epimerase [Paenibacillus chitinolyticus]MCY9597472.1 NAD-dependent epimerase [Paenibacillus chitinolyticus]QAV20675.1 NAD-dependent epimerase [Paenibacillus chitinolyticus]
MSILITGSAGFIGYHLALRLLESGAKVVGYDNLNDYYAVTLKQDRLKQLQNYPNYHHYTADLCDHEQLNRVFGEHEIRVAVNLAAQAGVRYSLQNPRAYADSNLTGFLNVLEACRTYKIDHLIYASSSSVYGANTKMPFSTDDPVDHPVSLYAATKKANELMAHSYSHLYGIPVTGLRFFTVYGPWGRPDMAYFSFTRNILEGKPIQVFNEGKMRRDFTYIDDIVEGIVRLLDRPPAPNKDWDRENPDPSTSYAPYKVYNIGNNSPVELMTFIRTLEESLGTRADIEFKPMQPGDVQATFADIDALQRDVGFRPSTPISEGLRKFADWYVGYYGSGS